MYSNHSLCIGVVKDTDAPAFLGSDKVREITRGEAVALGRVFAPQVTNLFSPGAIDEPRKFELTVELLRLTFPFLLFVSLTALSPATYVIVSRDTLRPSAT